MNNNLIEIYIGSEIETNYIASILHENNIACIIENRLNQSLSAGWASGSSYNSNIIRIDCKDVEKAKQIIHEFKKNKQNNIL